MHAPYFERHMPPRSIRAPRAAIIVTTNSADVADFMMVVDTVFLVSGFLCVTCRKSPLKSLPIFLRNGLCSIIPL